MLASGHRNNSLTPLIIDINYCNHMAITEPCLIGCRLGLGSAGRIAEMTGAESSF